MEINFGRMLDNRKERQQSFQYYFAWRPTFVYDRKLIWLKWYAAYKYLGNHMDYQSDRWHKYDLSFVAEAEDGTIYLCSDINRV